MSGVWEITSFPCGFLGDSFLAFFLAFWEIPSFLSCWLYNEKVVV